MDNILIDTHHLEKDFFDGEEQESSYNLMNEVSDFKNSFLDSAGKKGKKR